MTITYPRALPAWFRVRACEFEPLQVQTRAATRGGLAQVATLGRDTWRVRYDTPPLSDAEAHELLAWLDSLDGGARTFKAYHPLRRLARAYPNGYAGMTKAAGGSFTGEATLDAVGVQLDTVTLSGLPNAFVFSDGDFLSFSYASGRQVLHRVVEQATASGLGIVTLGVRPAVIPGFSLAVPVAVADPWCKAVLDARSRSVTWLQRGRAQVSFSAQQTLA